MRGFQDAPQPGDVLALVALSARSRAVQPAILTPPQATRFGN